jgi:fumarylacetoacetate (FAA) hydrolase family protein
VPPGDFTLQKNDEVEITIPPIGVLRNKIGMKEE